MEIIRDMLLKLHKYVNAGVREYWIVDPEQKTVLVYDLEHENYYPVMMKDSDPDYLQKVKFLEGNTEYSGFAPRENIRIKMTGAGLNFVHGGISLQEMVVPVTKQISNIGSEVARAIRWKKKGDDQKTRNFCNKAIEFWLLTEEDPRNRHRTVPLMIQIRLTGSREPG